jgi:hypothetical protein
MSGITRVLILILFVAANLGAAARSSARAAADVSAAIDASNWMGALAERIGDVPLNQLVIPGTHDSGTSSITGSAPDPFLKGVPFSPDQFGKQWSGRQMNALDGLVRHAILNRMFLPWGRAQDASIGQQLVNGARYLDLRVCSGPNPDPALYICHGLYGGEMQSTVLTPIEHFIQAHPKEVVILDFHHFASIGNQDSLTPARNQQLAAQIATTFAGQLIPPGSLGAAMTLNDIWRTPGRIIVLYSDAATTRNNPSFWPYADTSIAWPQTDRLATLEQQVTANLRCGCDIRTKYSASRASFFDLQLQMTPVPSMIRAGIMDRYLDPAHILHPPHSLLELAASNKPMLARLLSLLAQSPALYRPHLNVITTDFPETVPLVALAEMLDTLPISTLEFNGAPPSASGSVPIVVTSATTVSVRAQGTSTADYPRICRLLTLNCPPNASGTSVFYRVYPVESVPPAFTVVPGATASLTLSGLVGSYEIDYYAGGPLGSLEPMHRQMVLLSAS